MYTRTWYNLEPARSSEKRKNRKTEVVVVRQSVRVTGLVPGIQHQPRIFETEFDSTRVDETRKGSTFSCQVLSRLKSKARTVRSGDGGGEPAV